MVIRILNIIISLFSYEISLYLLKKKKRTNNKVEKKIHSLFSKEYDNQRLKVNVNI